MMGNTYCHSTIIIAFHLCLVISLLYVETRARESEISKIDIVKK